MAMQNHSEHSGGRHAGHSVADFRRRFWISLAVTVPVLLISPGVPLAAGGRLVTIPGADWILLGLSTFLYAYGGMPFLKGMVRELRARTPGMMTLVAVAISVAYLYSAATVFGLEGMPFFWELATLIDIMLLGHWVEMRSVGEASKALESLAELMPSAAHRRNEDGSLSDVPLEHLQLGDTVVIRPGEKVPADGDVLEGSSALDESMLTGESVPVSKSIGDQVIGGAVNGEGSLVVAVARTGADSFLAQVIDLVREAQESKSTTQDLADRAAMWLTVVALGGGALTFVVWLALGEPLAYAMERAVTVMVIACPHALGLAIPLVVAVSTSLGARNGLLVRNRMAFENSRSIDAVIFDKTGTLTLGRFGVEEVVSFSDLAEAEILSLAGSIEELSEHPVARAIAEATSSKRRVDGFLAIPGKGARGTIDGHRIDVVSPGYLEDEGIALPAGADALAVWRQDGRLRGARRRPRWFDRPIGHDPARVTRCHSAAQGDGYRDDHAHRRQCSGRREGCSGTRNRSVLRGSVTRREVSDGSAHPIGGQGRRHGGGRRERRACTRLGGRGYRHRRGHGCGRGHGRRRTRAQQSRRHTTAVALARATYRKMIQNLAWATGYNVIAIPLAAGVLAGAGVLLSPAVGGLLMSVSTVVVAINARMLRVKL